MLCSSWLEWGESVKGIYPSNWVITETDVKHSSPVPVAVCDAQSCSNETLQGSGFEFVAGHGFVSMFICVDL